MFAAVWERTINTAFESPDHIGPYRVIRPLGEGGMSEVFVVEDPASEEHLALKLLMEVGDAIPRFDREYEALIRLNHPCIVRVYNYGLHEKRPWFSMELLEGHSLQSWMKRCGRPGTAGRTAEVIRVGFCVAKALSYIHRRHLIHRDLKSSNVMVLPDGRVKLLDFGTAHVKHPAEVITQEGEFIGTFAYASPEQFRGSAVDHRADLYSLGVLLYRLATGRRPFRADKPAELAALHLRRAPVPPMTHVPSLPQGLNDLILHLMEKTPRARPQKASAVVRRLMELAGRPLFLTGFGLSMRTHRPVGRERELKLIERVLDGTAGRSILVTGARGSALAGFVNMAAMDARTRGLEVVVCTLKEEDSMASFLHTVLLATEPLQAKASIELRTAREGLSELLSRSPLERYTHKEVLLVAVSTLLSHLMVSVGKSLVVVVHNQQVATSLTMEMFSRLAHFRQARGGSLQFLLAADPSQWQTDTNLRQRFPGGLHLQLKPLSVRQVALTVGAMLARRPPPDRLARVIHTLSGGEPVWVEQVVQRLVDAGQLRALGGEGNHLEWDNAGLDDLALPSHAVDAVLSSFHLLPIYARRTLQALSLCGEVGTTSVLAHCMGWEAARMGPVLALLVRGGWVATSGGGNVVQWCRPLEAKIVADPISPLRRAVFLRALGGLVESLPPSHIKVSVLLAEGQLHHAMKVALLCAREFTETQQFLKAIELLEEVVEAIRDESDLDRVMSGRIHLLHADVLMRVRPMDRALARSLTIARALAQQPVTLTHVALLQARQHRQLGHYPAFRKTVNTAWAHVSETADAALKSRVASYQMQAWLTLGQMDPATEWMRVSGHWAALSEDESVVATARLFSGHLALIQGRLRDAETQLSMSIALFQRTNDRRGLWLAIPFWAEALRFQGRFSEALARLYRELPQARQSHMPLHYLRFLLVIARCEVDLCRLGKAQDCVDELEVNIRRGEQLSLRLDTQLVKGRIQLMSGQNREAKVILETAHEQARQAELPVTAASARALLGEAMWGVHAYEEAAVFFETSRVALVSSGDMASLAQATRSSARGLRGTASPEVVFEPVAQFLAEEPAEVLRLEQCLARARHFRDCGRAPESHEQYCQAVEQLSRLSQSLNETDKAALRVHPWAVQIRIGMR